MQPKINQNGVLIKPGVIPLGESGTAADDQEQALELRFDGQWLPDAESVEIGARNFKTLINMRYRGMTEGDLGIEGVKGYSKINVTPPLHQFDFMEFVVEVDEWGNDPFVMNNTTITITDLRNTSYVQRLPDWDAIVINLTNLGLSGTAVNHLLCDLVSAEGEPANGVLTITGNTAPSGAGVTCQTTLVARGWTVTT